MVVIDLFYDNFLELKICYINVINIMKLMMIVKNLEGFSDEEFDCYFIVDKLVIFVWYGFCDMI